MLLLRRAVHALQVERLQAQLVTFKSLQA